ncbi:LacI family DNA-binding transcriptional regulator [Coraliomargarita parva]|uniref:LacI family DNA-binding transcriptional regulator n=1 Tax=Coraliomargarita parva TaxID=3014050 RepID=UPI0022B5CB84|nr:LacI family DNA-binding transcriptional regulator [Coraliomargarita parva]
MSDSIPTIREIAKACGCNNSTVSRALSNKPNISPATRERVQKIAKDMGWRPNPIVAAYAAHRRASAKPQFQATLAYLLDNETLNPEAGKNFKDNHFRGARNYATKLGYKVETFKLAEVDYNTRRLCSMIRNRGIPGVIIPDIRTLNFLSESEFDWESFAMATSDYAVHSIRLHRSAYYWPQGMRIIIEKIKRYGYHKTALILHESFDKLTDYVLTSAFYHFEKHHDKRQNFKSYIIPEGSKDVLGQVESWLVKNKPQVVIATDETWNAIQHLKLRVPDDIAYVSPHWSPDWPQIAGLNQNWEVMGANAVELIANQINSNERGIPTTPKMLFNEGFWVDGASLPNRNSTDSD